MLNTITTVITGTVLVFLIAALVAVIIATPLWLLWNWLMPVIFGLKAVTWLQALGLAFLSSILFKSSSTKS